ncbi:MAG: NfeD family protein [Lachnospiraceae bacterium]|nr:NfeD family protein [Lachnospiraceae bacterium]
MEKVFIFWIGLLVIFLLVEIATVGLTSIWFAGGALVAGAVCIMGGSLWLQVVLFFVVSFVLLYFTRPWALRFVKPKNVKTNYEELEGKTVRILETVNNIEGTGRAIYNGMEWSARAERDDVTFEVEELAQVLRVQGVKLILQKKENSK